MKGESLSVPSIHLTYVVEVYSELQAANAAGCCTSCISHLSVRATLRSRLKYLNHYWMHCHEISYSHPWCQEYEYYGDPRVLLPFEWTAVGGIALNFSPHTYVCDLGDPTSHLTSCWTN